MNCPNCSAIPATRIAANTTCGYPICAKCGVYWPESECPVPEERHEAVRLFEPAPTQLAGQLGF